MSRETFLRKELIAELRRVVKMMEKEEKPEKQLYYYSAAYGITGRTLRYSFSKDLLLTDFVLQTSYNILKERIDANKIGDMTVPVEELHFKKLIEGLKELIDRFESEKDLLGPLENIITVAFSTTGPGRYLLEKGDLEL